MAAVGDGLTIWEGQGRNQGFGSGTAFTLRMRLTEGGYVLELDYDGEYTLELSGSSVDNLRNSLSPIALERAFAHLRAR